MAFIRLMLLKTAKMHKNIINFNSDANKKWGKPVFYLYYDDKENFVNIDEMLKFS